MSRAEVEQRMDTRPQEPDITQPRLGPLGLLRWAWRQLTSMRTALFLLLLLAIGAVPGSLWPQRNVDANRVATYLADHRTSGPWLDRLGMFDVYSSPWFAAIYLLLFVSLVGCVVPRSRLHWRAMRARPPKAPQRLDRLSAHAEREVDATPQEVLAAAREVLRHKRFRVRAAEDGEGADQRGRGAVSAESGYLRETGNLVFHTALLVVIVAVALGHLFGWRGDVILPVGQPLSNTVSAYDTFAPGVWVTGEKLPPFSLTVNKLDVTFSETGGKGQFGEPRDFVAYTSTRSSPGAPARQSILKVDHPLSMSGASIFLLGNGYAPVITVRNGAGKVVYGPQATPFLAQDNEYTSAGAVKVSAALPKQLGFVGFFLPTYSMTANGPQSIFPGPQNPALVLTAYEGQLFPDNLPQSVYTLDTTKMTQLKDGKQPLRMLLQPGQTFTLPGHRGSITFDSVSRFAGLSVRYDPGKQLALYGSLLALAGLIASLTIRRRRIFVRAASPTTPGATGPHPSALDQGTATGRTLVRVGGLAKSEDQRLQPVLDQVLAAIVERTERKS